MVAVTPPTDRAGSAGGSVGQRSITNSAWSFGAVLLSKLSTFVVTIILARLLAPEQFGLIGYCILAMQFFDIISRFGLDSALISRGETAEADASSVFFIALGLSIAVYATAWITAPHLAEFFRAEEVTDLFRVIAIVLLIEAVGLVHNALLSVRLRFRAKLVPTVGRSVVKGVVAIALALSGYGVWSLVYGQLAGAAFHTFGLWMVCRWRPSARLDRDTFLSVFRFGRSMIGVELIGALRSNVDYAFVGRALGASALGIYTIAYRLPELVIRSLNMAVGAVTHPMLVSLRAEPDAVTRYYVAYLRFISLLTMPMGVGLAIVAEPFVLVFYGEAWREAILPMQAIALALAISSVGFAPGVLYKALNRPDILRNLSLLKLPIVVVVLWHAVEYGLTGVALSQVGLAVLYVMIDSVAVGRFAGIALSEMARSVMPSVICSAGMGLGGAWLGRTLDGNDVLELLALIVTGTVLYILLLRVLSRATFFEVLTTLKSVRSARRSEVKP